MTNIKPKNKYFYLYPLVLFFGLPWTAYRAWKYRSEIGFTLLVWVMFVLATVNFSAIFDLFSPLVAYIFINVILVGLVAWSHWDCRKTILNSPKRANREGSE